jgi:hypothetical protein
MTKEEVMAKARRGLKALSGPPEGNPVRIVMDYHGLSQRDSEYILDLIEQGGGDIWEMSEGALKRQAGLMIDWVNKNGDWPE